MISLIRLFQNLISNSIKYSVQDPVVEITSQIENQSITINISDNGVGIDSAEIDKVFIPDPVVVFRTVNLTRLKGETNAKEEKIYIGI